MRKTLIGLFATGTVLASGIALAQQPAAPPTAPGAAPVPAVKAPVA